MEINFHYYVTYTAAVRAGFSKNEAVEVARAAQYVDECYDVTTQGTSRLIFSNMVDTLPFYYGKVRDILNIWPVFHFLPGNTARISADVDPGITNGKKVVAQAPGLICGTESKATAAIVEAAKTFWADADATTQQKLLRVGITMHVLADTFAHQGFAGIPLFEVNEVAEVKTLELMGNTDCLEKKSFGKLEKSPSFTSSSFGNLGHGRIGHLPDQPGCTFYYRAQWRKAGDPYIARCNPLEFYCAYLTMIEAMQYIRGGREKFSNQVDRALLLDNTRGRWPETKKFVDMFNAANQDATLVRPWFLLVQDVEFPDAYVPYDKKREASLQLDFEKMAKAFHDCVFADCAELRAYYALYE